jgi:hypothetical protein
MAIACVPDLGAPSPNPHATGACPTRIARLRRARSRLADQLRCGAAKSRGRLPSLQTCYRKSTLQRTRDKPMGIHDIWLFVGAGLLLNITPGPEMALISVEHTNEDAGRGRRPWRGSRHGRSLLRRRSEPLQSSWPQQALSPSSSGSALYLT